MLGRRVELPEDEEEVGHVGDEIPSHKPHDSTQIDRNGLVKI